MNQDKIPFPLIDPYLQIVFGFLFILGVVRSLLIKAIGYQREGWAIIIRIWGKNQPYYSGQHLYILLRGVGDLRTIDWTRSTSPSSALDSRPDAIRTQNLVGYEIPTFLVSHDISSVACMTEDSTPTNVDTLFYSRVTDPNLAVSGEAPLDLWRFVEDAFAAEISAYVKCKHSRDFNTKSDTSQLADVLLNNVNSIAGRYGIKISDVRVQNVRFSEAVTKIEEEKKIMTITNDLAKEKSRNELGILQRKAVVDREIAWAEVSQDAVLINKLKVECNMNNAEVLAFIVAKKIGPKTPIMYFGAGSLPVSRIKPPGNLEVDLDVETVD